MPQLLKGTTAFGEPGIEPRWTSARKDGIGTAYSVASRVWFTLWEGIVTEIYYPTVDRPQIRDWQFLISDGETFFHEEKRDLVTRTEYVSEDALAFRVIKEHAIGYRLEKTIISDPHLPCVLQHVKVHAPAELRKRLRFYSLCSPHCGGGGANNNAHVCTVNGTKILVANKKNTWLAMGGSLEFSKTSCGYVGYSDGWTDLADNLVMDWEFDCATAGNVAITGEFTLGDADEFTMALSFGHGLHNAVTGLLQTLSDPFDQHLNRFRLQWQRASKLEETLAPVTSDNGFLLRASHKILLAHEDKLNPGAFIASLSVPWGQAKGDEDIGGYHLVWPRDMVNTVTALTAAGRDDTPLRALTFFACNQLDDGRFPQNFWISGEPYWSGVQLDEVAFPIMLAWRLKQHHRIKGFDPFPMMMKAAAFLILNGPVTQQDRWEEVFGFSPSTLAANIAALICAASVARERGEEGTASFLEDYADYLHCHLREWTVTTSGELHPEVSEHFVRVNPVRTPEYISNVDSAEVGIANLRPDEQSVFPARNVIDAGFLELVRYGILSPHEPLIVDSLKVVDHVLKVETPYGPCWRRYNHDGYGNGADGSPFTGTGIGRAWPLLTGERGHYELAAGNDVHPYIEAMEKFATCGGTLPEQVWDTEDIDEARLHLGRPTGSAMPLVWAHSEYIKLLRSARDAKVFDTIPPVVARYIDNAQACKLVEIWHKGWQVGKVRHNFTLRIIANEPFQLLMTRDGWNSNTAAESTATVLEVHYVDVAVGHTVRGPIEFTFFWKSRELWENHNYTVSVG